MKAKIKEYWKYKINDKSSINSEDGKKYSEKGYVLNTFLERQTQLPCIVKKKIILPQNDKTLKIFQDELNSTEQLELGEIQIGKHNSEEIEVEIEAISDGLVIITINVDDKKIRNKFQFY